MTVALRELIELLLTEIAICGTNGTPLADIWDLVNTFHNDHGASNFHLDRDLQEDLWEWLTLNPEVSVGQAKEYNKLTLSEAEDVPDLRVFVSEERIWKALTGHDKDESKVPSNEFALLSIIASCRTQGILQTELVRRSGQDARSVPKRTDALTTKGYIEKRLVQAKSAKTSLCVFSRFLTAASADASDKSGNLIDIDAFLQGIFSVLKQHQIISRNDLKDELDFNDTWRRRILSRTIRKFETIGCLKRVKARSQFHETMKSLHPCVLLVREPTEADMKLFKNDYRALFSTIDQENEDAEEQADMQFSDHTPIKWTPDVSVPNLISNIIQNSGTNGRTNAQLIKEGFGKIFRRPSEHTLNRIVEGWQLSQPSHLRRRAIVRDIAINGTVTHYVHYSWPHFKELVDSSRAQWAAVSFKARDARSAKLTVPPPDVPSIIDEDGLAPLLVRKGVTERDHYCLIFSKGLKNYAVTRSDPVPIVDEEGDVVISFERERDVGFRRESRHIVKARESPKPEPIQTETIQQIERAPSPGSELDVNMRSAPMTKAEKMDIELKRGDRPAREVFAAFGMDESWTFVAVHLMERTTPGIYITRKGKARPATKRQGRPKESRIAIFKSPTLVDYLKSLPGPALGTPPAPPAQPTPPPATSPPAREPSIVAVENRLAEPADLSRKATPKSNRRKSAKAANISPPKFAPTTSTPTSDVTMSEAPETTPILSDVQDKDSAEADGQVTTTMASRRSDLEEPTLPPDSSTPAETQTEDFEPTETVSSEPNTPGYTKSRRLDREGSVSLLRRSIIMGIIEQAGGAFPTGTALWYAFATVWMKRLNHNEKPDSRTVKNVMNALVDAGKLRKTTFSGKGPKGYMVTHSIVMKPDISPSDPLVTQMKEKLLESNFYVPESVDVDSEISRIIRGGTGAPTGVYSKPVPVVESAITVNLRNKPATVIALEKRKELSLQRRLSKPIRLMGIKRRGKNQTSEGGITSFSRPRARKIRKTHREPSEQAGPSEPARLAKGDVIPMDIDAAERPRPAKRGRPRKADRPLSEIKRRKYVYDSGYGQFLDHLEDISQWERDYALWADTGQTTTSSHTDTPYNTTPGFIHHTIQRSFEQAPVTGSIRFVGGGRGRPKRDPALTPASRKRSSGTLRPRPKPLLPALSNSVDPDSALLPSSPIYEPPSPEEVRSPSDEEIDEPEPEPIEDDQSPEVSKKLSISKRRRRGLKDLPSSLIERMKYAIIIVRTLAGGAYGKTVDWDLVVRAFPDEDPYLILDHGRLLLNRDRSKLAQMQDDIRAKILAEFRKRKPGLPSIDFNNMASYDWDRAVTWATTQYYTPSTRDVPNLPGSQAQFKQHFGHRVEQVSDELDSIYIPHATISIAKRASIFSSRPFVNALKSADDYDQDRQNATKEAAKSWVLSNIAAREETYDAADARRKLSHFPEDMIEEVIKELTRDRIISQSNNRGRIVPGRNFNLTDLFYQAFGRKRTIDTDILKQASKFKRVLDDDFKRDGVAQVKYDALDGDVLAIMALAAEGRIHILPSDPPVNPFGLTEGNYETRALDKIKFKFGVDVIPDTERYEYGNPAWDKISKHRAVPMSDPDKIKQLFNNEEREKLPLWVDINGNVQDQLWESIVSGIVGILAIRPKLDLKGIHEQLQGYLPLWDIERALEWLEGVDIVSKDDGGGGKSIWAVKEYWWLVLG